MLQGRVIKVTPVITAAAYTNVEQLGVAMKLANAAPASGAATELSSVSIVDKANQKSAIDLFFFDSQPTLASADHANFDLTDAEMLKCLGCVSLVAGDYSASASNAVASKGDLRRILKPIDGSKDLWIVAVSRGTPTYTSISDLQITVGFRHGEGRGT